MRFPHLRQFKRLLQFLGTGIGTTLLILCLQLHPLFGNAQLVPSPSLASDSPTASTPLVKDSSGNLIALAPPNLTAQATPSTSPALELEQQGKTYYQQGQLEQAVTVWKQAAAAFAAQDDRLHQAMTLSHLSLAYQHLGQWDNANTTIRQSLELLKTANQSTTHDRLHITAEALTIQGSLQFNQGNAANAFKSWQQAENTFQQAGDKAGITRSQINQSQALVTLGLYKRANKLLESMYEKLPPEPPLQLATLLNFGETLRLVGRLKAESANTQLSGKPSSSAESVLHQGLELAQKLNSPPDITTAQISLGNTYRALYQQQKRLQPNPDCPDAQTLQYYSRALESYQAAAQTTNTPIAKIQALLNQQSLLLIPQSNSQLVDESQVQAIASQIQSQLDRQPLNRIALYARIQLAQNLLKLEQNSKLKEAGHSPQAAQLLEVAVKQAETLGDYPAQSYAMGYLGQAYEQQQQRNNAQTQTKQALILTTKALELAKTINAPEIAYRWFWQLGRLDRESNPELAIKQYRSAYQTLQTFRSNLPADNPDLQFSFQAQPVERVYREFVDLLLQPQNTATKQLQETGKGEKSRLQEAREVMRAIQVTALQNFLQEPCTEAGLQLLDTIVDAPNSSTATLFPIILSDRIEVIAKLPSQPLFHYRTPISEPEVRQAIEQFQRDLQESYTFDVVKAEGQQLYQWLIQPVQDQLESAQIKTIVFVLDGPLRNIPMAALYDGQQYLIQKYAVSTSLGLDVSSPKSLPNERLSVLAASLAKPASADLDDGFAELPFVNQELQSIQTTKGIDVTPIQDSRFTRDLFNQKLNDAPFNVVHLATHGKFSSNPEETYILTSPSRIANGKLLDSKIRINDFDQMFRTRDLNRKDAIELLILSACETASGDDRATLGIAGAAYRAGARSAIASLWSLDDQSSQKLIKEFYQAITQPHTSRAEALQQAQKALLETNDGDGDYSHPRYWAPFLLVGNWL